MQAVGTDVVQRVLTWWYRRLGKRYPAAFMALELQTAWFITVGLLALLNLYYDVPHGDLVLVLAITLGLTAVTVSVSAIRSIDTCACFRVDRQRSRRPVLTEGMGYRGRHARRALRRDMRLPIFWSQYRADRGGSSGLSPSPSFGSSPHR
jgi:hypothetical protein